MLSNAMVVAANMGCMSKKISVRSPLVTCAYIILVGGFKHLLFSISYMGSSFPLTNSYFQDGYCTTNQLGFSAPVSLTKPSVGRACQDFSYTGGTSDSAKTIIFQPSSWLGDPYLTGCATAA
jgi:hypothetical protein